MRGLVGRLLVAGVLLSALAIAEGAAPAGAAVPCAVTSQRSSTPAGRAAWDPALSADGSITFFVSDANIGGQNADGNAELWRRVGNVTTRLTNNDGDYEIGGPDVSADGRRAVFTSEADLANTNVDHVETLWLWDLDAEITLTALQNPEAPGVRYPRIAAAGEPVVFDSRVDWDGDSPDGNMEVFLRTDEGAQQISPNTVDEDGSRKPAISGDGEVVVYESDRDPTGDNPDTNVELYRYVVDTGVTTQITDTEADESQDDWRGSYLPQVDGDGSTVVFETEVAHGSLNTDLQYQVMRWDNGTISEVTTDDAESYDASVSADGTRVAFMSEGDPVGRNADGNQEIFLAHGGTIRQVTRTVDVENWGRIGRDGKHLALVSDGNFLGTNADGSFEVFVATCGTALKCDGQTVTVVVGQNNPTAGNDVILGTRGNDVVNGGAGKDTFCGLAGNDRFTGGAGNDRFLGDVGNDTGNGGAGTDTLKGQAGNDTLIGGAGPGDVCDGGPGTDTASGCEQRPNVP
jgi:Tol biopolymer transport system component